MNKPVLFAIGIEFIFNFLTLLAFYQRIDAPAASRKRKSWLPPLGLLFITFIWSLYTGAVLHFQHISLFSPQ